MNIQEQILRIQSMMGLIQEETLICKHCNERTKKNIETLSPEIKDKVIKFIDNVFTKFKRPIFRERIRIRIWKRIEKNSRIQILII